MTVAEDALPYNKRINKGELPQYHVSQTHEPIVERIQFELAKILREERNKSINTDYKEYPLSKKIKCAECGTTYRRKETNNTVYWVCRQHDDSKELCGGQRLTEASPKKNLTLSHLTLRWAREWQCKRGE